jgi:hypothetical protein
MNPICVSNRHTYKIQFNVDPIQELGREFHRYPVFPGHRSARLRTFTDSGGNRLHDSVRKFCGRRVFLPLALDQTGLIPLSRVHASSTWTVSPEKRQGDITLMSAIAAPAWAGWTRCRVIIHWFGRLGIPIQTSAGKPLEHVAWPFCKRQVPAISAAHGVWTARAGRAFRIAWDRRTSRRIVVIGTREAPASLNPPGSWPFAGLFQKRM